MDRLGARLRVMGLTLAYHNHDAELRQAARELHHSLLATDPKNVSFCFDFHWVYRGSGNSHVALMDVLKLYGNRVAELHLRQSKAGVWTETLCEGDIDYRTISAQLRKINVKPHLVLEQGGREGFTEDPGCGQGTEAIPRLRADGLRGVRSAGARHYVLS